MSEILACMISALTMAAFWLIVGVAALFVKGDGNWLTNASLVLSSISMVGFVLSFAFYK